jgi:hypothetical protein
MIRFGEIDRDDRGCDADTFLTQTKLLDFASCYDHSSPFSLLPPTPYCGISETLLAERSSRESSSAQDVMPPSSSRVHVNQAHLQRAWNVAQRSTASDWNE